MNHNEQVDIGLIDLTRDIVSAYVSKNNVPPAELATLIASTHAALVKLDAPVEPDSVKLVPRVPIKKSITPDQLIRLEDVKLYKSLKRHLGKYGLKPGEYRQKWSLSHDYPMVAPNYAAQRSELAKSFGLGQIRRDRAARAAEAKATEKGPGRRGRLRKTEAASAK